MSLHALVILSVIFAMAIPSWAKPIWNIYKTIFSGLFQLAKIVLTPALQLIGTALKLLFKGIGFLVQQFFVGLGAILVGLSKLLVELLKGFFLLLKAVLKYLKQQLAKLFNRN